MAAEDNLTLRIVGRYQGQNVVNTLCYHLTVQGDSDLDVCQNFCDQWDDKCRSTWLAAHSVSYDLVGLKCFRQNGTAKTPGFKQIAAAGTRSGTPAPNFVCRTITLYTASAKYRRRGRIMLSGSITEDFSSADGSLDAAGLAVVQAVGDKLMEGLQANGFNNGGQLIIPAAGADPEELITDTKARVTPSSVTSRRVRQFLIG